MILSEQHIAALLGLNVLTPSIWPKDLIQQLIVFEAANGYEALIKEIYKLISV